MTYVIVLGGGIFGKTLIEFFVERGIDVVLIDKNKEVCNEVTEEFGIKAICGDGIDPETLELADVKKANYFFAVTGNQEVNVFSSLLAREYGVKNIVVRVSNEIYIPLLKKVGFKHIIVPEKIAAEYVVNSIVLKHSTTFVEIDEVKLYRILIREDSKLVNKRLDELCSINPSIKIVGFKENVREPLREYVPDYIIKPGSIIYICTTSAIDEVLRNI